MLPAGTVRVMEGDRLMNSIGQKIQSGDTRKIRVLMQGMSIIFFSPLHHLSIILRQLTPFFFAGGRFHKLLPQEKCGAPRRARPFGGHSVSLQRVGKFGLSWFPWPGLFRDMESGMGVLSAGNRVRQLKESCGY